jgi:predicted phosphodiesterase
MILVGDVHGMLDTFRRRMKEMKKKFPDETVIQVGDLGLGFPKSESPVLPKHCKFIRGNHDNPAVCRIHPNYLGDFGATEIDGHSIFYVSGAWSIDRKDRTEGVSWWPDEELTIAELNTALDQYIATKPEIMITHDGPQQATTYILNRFMLSNNIAYSERTPTTTRTGQALYAMFEAYQPKLWVFGHWHYSWIKRINGTVFMCLNELEMQRFEDINFGE